MLDNKLLRDNLTDLAEKLKIKKFDLPIDTIQKLESERKEIQIITQDLQNSRNTISKSIGIAKSKGEDISEILTQVENLKIELNQKEELLNNIQEELTKIYFTIPNIPHSDVPEGDSEEQNQEIRRWGQPREFDFEPKDHVDLGEGIGDLDFASGAKITGARFVVMKNQIAKLHRALAQFMLDTHTQEHGYTEINVPLMVNRDSLYGTGQLPKFEEDLFHLSGQHGYSLISTAEIPVTNMGRDEIISHENLPIKFTCYSPCFRSEAGSHGKDTRGMIRQHQFEKVELVQMVHPDDSYQALEELTMHAETILQKLNLPYRVVVLCGGDLGFTATKTYDLEVWLPGQDTYREISSCSNFEDFQARRMQARYRDPNTKKPILLHTLNGSGLAVGRTLVAVLENYQNKDGSITVPEVLIPYMHGVEVIG